MLTSTQKVAILTAYGLVTCYYAAVLYAAWFRPALQRFWILRPRWRAGINASRFGVTAQAAFAFSLALFGATKMYGHPTNIVFAAISFVSAVVMLMAWATDYGHQMSERD